MDKISNWGRYPATEASIHHPETRQDAAQIIRKKESLIFRGNGRSYGDSSLQKTILSTRQFNQIIAFDTREGFIRCGSGVTLDQILQRIVPSGFFLPIIPGTKFISLGGALAANVHGKNHHLAGGIAGYVQSFSLLNDAGEVLVCSPEKNARLFTDTLGGMGLTGLILDAELKLRPIPSAYLSQTLVKSRDLQSTFELIHSRRDSPYLVAWLDLTATEKNAGRALVSLGQHCEQNQIPPDKREKLFELHKAPALNLPFNSPSWLLNAYSSKIFNALYYHRFQKKETKSIVHYDPFFFPLDRVSNWNRLYGKKGFLQYQFAVPFAGGRKAIREVIQTVNASGCTPFLAVLKILGSEKTEVSSLAFARPGYSLAIDFKNNKKVLALMDLLDQIVIRYEGKLYLAKDARMSKEVFQMMYPNAAKYSPKFSSLQSDRLGI